MSAEPDDYIHPASQWNGSDPYEKLLTGPKALVNELWNYCNACMLTGGSAARFGDS